jgi:hypothetical protein
MVQNWARDATGTPRTIMDPDLCNYKEKQAYFKSDHYKIVINSPEVYFGIQRQHAEVGHKSLIIFSYKKHLDRFCINGKHFI